VTTDEARSEVVVEPREKTLVEHLQYGEALTELEAILTDLESSAVDVDQLARNVQRAAALIAHCRGRLETVEADVANVVDRLGEPIETSPS
jgi:exodeoxyribonuclease VII small subunit